jgi:hypothetical protein
MAWLKFNRIRARARFRFTHIAGQDYRHYIEVVSFGRPVLKVNEYYLNGKARMELPTGTIENEPKVDMAANLGLWAESVWLPSIFLTDPRVRWEGIDKNTARLVVPFSAEEDSLTVRFDNETGLILSLEGNRYREATSEKKIPWRNEPLDWDEFNGILIPSPAAVTWTDQNEPWAVFVVEELVYNVDVTEYIRASGL